MEFIENDANVDIFSIERKIKIKNNELRTSRERIKDDSRKNTKCYD